MIPKITYPEKHNTESVKDRSKQAVAEDFNEIKSAVNAIIDALGNTVTLDKIPVVVDHLLDSSPNKALSAKQGTVLKSITDDLNNSTLNYYSEIVYTEGGGTGGSSNFNNNLKATNQNDIEIHKSNEGKFFLLIKKDTEQLDFSNCYIVINKKLGYKVERFGFTVKELLMSESGTDVYTLTPDPTTDIALQNNARYTFGFWRKTPKDLKKQKTTLKSTDPNITIEGATAKISNGRLILQISRMDFTKKKGTGDIAFLKLPKEYIPNNDAYGMATRKVNNISKGNIGILIHGQHSSNAGTVYVFITENTTDNLCRLYMEVTIDN